MSWSDELWWEADSRHVEKMLEDIGLEDCKPGAVPGTQPTEEQDGELELDRETAWKYRSIVARANFLAQDRPDIRYAVKELCREMSCPKMRSWGALKKLCRYLRGVPRMVQRVPIVGETSEYLEIFVDSDWAGCQGTRNSTKHYAPSFSSHCHCQCDNWCTTVTWLK